MDQQIKEQYELFGSAYKKSFDACQLIIGFDISDNSDHSCMTVFQRGHIPGQFIHVNTFWDGEACELYEKLGGGQVVCGKDKLELLKDLAETEKVEPYIIEGGKGGSSCDGLYVRGKDY